MIGFTFLLFVFISTSHGEIMYECPEEWMTYSEKCYKFVFYPALNYDDARAECGSHGATLLGVNTMAEHNFVSSWLLQTDLSREEWYTSGVVNSLVEGDLVWESDGTLIPPDQQYWVSEEDRNKTGRNIIYVYGVTQYGWSRTQESMLHSYICEIALDEAFRIIQEERDFDYGTNITDPNEVPRGPRLITQPYDMVEIGNAITASIECVATGLPPPTYQIYRIEDNTHVQITPGMDDRYSITNGKLTIADPRETPDAGSYFCEAENVFGMVVSRKMSLSFGDLGEFSNVEWEPVTAPVGLSAVIECIPPQHRPAVAYNWLKGAGNNFIRTDINPHMFISHNGKLYFSEVSVEDEEYYRCVVKLISDNGAQIGSSQPPSRVSLRRDLILTDNVASNWGPEIANDFIASFPRLPKRGQRVRLECLAYGTMPITYSWAREDLPIPTTAILEDHNRILTIVDVQLEDAGTYICHAQRGSNAQTQKSFTLRVEAVPYFIYPLRDQHADIGSKLTWRCDARAVPTPKYAWLKNGEPLTPIPGDINIVNNILTINTLDPTRHNGIYQCSATNSHGVGYSSAQLRVLAFKPSFSKDPLEVTHMGTVGGNVTITCNPESAPAPTYRWSKNGQDMNLPEGDTTARIRKLKNGNLFISPAQLGDSGQYGCTAENIYGSAASYGILTIINGITISNAPRNTEVMVNNTAFLMCQASHRDEVDMIYDWWFEGRPINFNDPHYRLGAQEHLNGLYIISVQQKYAGRYECMAKTTFERLSREAMLTVLGPPGEASGLYVETVHTTARSMVLWWTIGPAHGRDIISYNVLVSTNFNKTWIVHLSNIREQDTIVDGFTKRRYLVEGLKPGTGYKFSLRASNLYGLGPMSVPSDMYQSPTAPPVVIPGDVGGGGGSVGDLTITWEPLLQEDHGAPGFGYTVFWRLSGTTRWNRENVSAEHSQHVVTVGQELFYTQYDVMVQAFNDRGQGPNSTIQMIYSAEDMPVGTPLKVYAFPFNSTAMNVTWTAVDDNREVMRGVVKGYRINYQAVGEDKHAQHNIIYTGQRERGLVIGLDPFKWYIFDVQVLNSAGLGPISEIYRQNTWGHPPLQYPTEVYVFSHGVDSVRVFWRGITTGADEEPIMGYKVRYWVSTDDIRTSYDHVTGKADQTVIYGVAKDSLYKMRIFGFSRGGDGKMSPDVYFTLGGTVRIDPETAEIRAGCAFTNVSVLLLSVTLLLHCLMS